MYRTLQPAVGGTVVVPGYVGPRTYPLGTGRPNQQRWARIILLELIQGEHLIDMIERTEREKRWIIRCYPPTTPASACCATS